MKHISIAGNVGKDAVLRTTQGGDKVAGWSVAVEERGPNGAKSTVWFDVSLWGRRGEALASYLTKGTRVAVAGELSTREHDSKTYLTVKADAVTLLGGGADRERANAGDRQSSGDGFDAKADAAYDRSLDDSIPF